MRARRGAVGAVVAAALLATLGVTTGARAHAVLVRSSPAAGAVLARPPARVELWFAERLERAFTRVVVLDATGARVDQGPEAPVAVGPTAADPRRVAVTLVPLGPGVYTVRYRVLSVDGHVVEGAFAFRVGTAP